MNLRLLFIAALAGAVGCQKQEKVKDTSVDDTSTTTPNTDRPTPETGGSTPVDTGETSVTGETDTGGTSPPAGPTYHEDVAPILQERCYGCHVEGGVGPFRVDDYATVALWAPAIVASVEARTMPPWLVVDDGSCQTFQHSRWMSEDEIATIAAWAEAGAAQGDPAAGPRWELPETDLPGVSTVLETPEFIPEITGGPLAQFDEYRCFALDNPYDVDKFLTGFAVHPGNQAIVHHVLAMPVEYEAPSYLPGLNNGQVIAFLDAQDDREGWNCFGTAGDGVRDGGIPIVWAPGQTAVELPEGVGVRIRPGQTWVVQMHYNLSDPTTLGQSDRTTLELRMADEVAREGWMALPDRFLESLFSGSPESIPPGEPAWEYSFDVSMGEVLGWGDRPVGTPDVRLHAVLPHMHAYGASMSLDLVRASGDECAMRVPRWDFNWQLTYFFLEAIPLADDDRLRVSCTWDTTGAPGPVTPGWGTYNEMCLLTLLVSAPI